MKKLLLFLLTVTIICSLFSIQNRAIKEIPVVADIQQPLPVQKRVTETNIEPQNTSILMLVEEEKTEEVTEWEPPFSIPTSLEEIAVDVGILIDYDTNDVSLDLVVFCADYNDSFTHILNLYKTRPDLRAEFIDIGRYLTANNLEHLIYPSGSGFREVPHIMEKSKQMADALKVIYNAFRFDGWIGPYRGCWNSPFYGAGLEYCEYLFKRGRAWENCLATLEFESTYGLGGTCYYGMLDGTGHPNTLEGYCNYLDENGVSNDPYEQAWFWNAPGAPKYQESMIKFVTTVKGWYP